MRVSVTESESEGRRLEMLRRWKKADLVTLLMWDRNERMESRMKYRFRTSDHGEVEQPSMTRTRSPLSATDRQKQRPLVDRHEHVPKAVS
jgi:hypothetical protein